MYLGWKAIIDRIATTLVTAFPAVELSFDRSEVELAVYVADRLAVQLFFRESGVLMINGPEERIARCFPDEGSLPEARLFVEITDWHLENECVDTLFEATKVQLLAAMRATSRADAALESLSIAPKSKH